MKKRLFSIFALLLCCGVLLTGCSTQPVPEGVDESALLEAGREVLDLLIAEDYQTVYDRIREDIRADVTVDEIAAVMDPVLEEAGDFQSVDQSSTYGDEEEEPLAAAEFLCVFSESEVRFRIVFDLEMNLTGFAVGEESSGGPLSNLWDSITGFFGG